MCADACLRHTRHWPCDHPLHCSLHIEYTLATCHLHRPCVLTLLTMAETILLCGHCVLALLTVAETILLCGHRVLALLTVAEIMWHVVVGSTMQAMRRSGIIDPTMTVCTAFVPINAAIQQHAATMPPQGACA